MIVLMLVARFHDEAVGSRKGKSYVTALPTPLDSSQLQLTYIACCSRVHAMTLQALRIETCSKRLPVRGFRWPGRVAMVRPSVDTFPCTQVGPQASRTVCTRLAPMTAELLQCMAVCS